MAKPAIGRVAFAERAPKIKPPAVTAPPRHVFALSETVFTIEQCADYLHVSRPTIFKLIKDGKLKTFTIGARRLIRGGDLDAYVKSATAS